MSGSMSGSVTTITCRRCGESSGPVPVQAAIAWNAGHDFVCPGVSQDSTPTPKRRTITIDLDTGEWVSRSSILFEGDAFRVASSVLPGMPVEEIARAYNEWMGADVPPEDREHDGAPQDGGVTDPAETSMPAPRAARRD